MEKQSKSELLLPVVPGTLQNLTDTNGRNIGFSLMVRMLNARGCFLSILNGFYLKVDDKIYGRHQQKIAIHGIRPRTIEELKNASFEHWDPWEKAVLYVETDRRIEPGEHIVTCIPRLMEGYFKSSEKWIDEPPSLDEDLSESEIDANTLCLTCIGSGE